MDAALSGDRNLVVQALLAHPGQRSTLQGEKVCDEILRTREALLVEMKLIPRGEAVPESGGERLTLREVVDEHRAALATEDPSA